MEGRGEEVDDVEAGVGKLGLLHGDWSELPEMVQQAVMKKAALLQPRGLWLATGTQEEAETIRSTLIATNALLPLQGPGPNSFLARGPVSDAGQATRGRIWTSTPEREQTEGTEQMEGMAVWLSPSQASLELEERFPGAMRGRLLYVVPFSLGPIGSRMSLSGVHLTDSPLVLLHLRLLVRIGSAALWRHGVPTPFVLCIHTTGRPLPNLTSPVHSPSSFLSWESNPSRALVIHRPLDHIPSIWSFGSGYSGNAILTKKCLALRLAGVLASGENWMPAHMAHMAVLSVERERDGVKHWFGAAFPSGCGKTDLALLKPNKPGYTIRCYSDDVVWLRWNPHTGRLCALNPEIGLYATALSTNPSSNPTAVAALYQGNAIYTNVALRLQDRLPLWDDMNLDDQFNFQDSTISDWRGRVRPLLDRKTGRVATNVCDPNARFTISLSQVPGAVGGDEVGEYGVPLDAIMFGSRRSTRIPLVYEASGLHIGQGGEEHACCPWLRGVAIGAGLRSEYRGVDGRVGLRHEPFAMRPFIGYRFHRFLEDWLRLGLPPAGLEGKAVLPRIYHVNWFRTNESTRNLLWPGFGENLRVLEWMMERLEEGPAGNGLPSPIGRLSRLGIVPTPSALDLEDLGISRDLLFHQEDKELEEEAAIVSAFLRKNAGPDLPLPLLNCALHHIPHSTLSSPPTPSSH